MTHLSAWLRPPRFADEEKTRQAYLLNIILWVLIIVPIPFLVYTQLFSPEAWRRVLTQVLSGEAVNVFLLVLLRRGYVRIASIIQIAAFWAFFTATAWTGAGIYTQAYQIGQALVICIAGFLIGVHGALIMVGVSLLSGGLMVAAADMGWWSFKPPDKALTVWVVSAVLFPVLAVLQYLAGRLLRTALAQSRMSQAQYRNLVQHIPMRIFIKDLNSVYVSCNPNYARDLGIEPEQIVGKDDFAFYARDLAEGYRADDRAVVGGEAPKEVEEKYMVSGQELWIHTIKVPYRDHEGHVVGVLGIFEDITDRRQAQEMLRGSEERFRSLVETTSDWIWETDAENRYTYASPQSRNLLGYEPEEIIGRKPFDFMTPEEAERIWAVFERPRSAKRPFYNLENVNLRKDGRKVVLETSGVPRLDSHGNFLGYRGIDRDITERKRAEDTLKQRTLELQHLTETLEERVKERTAELAHLSSRLVFAQENERKRVSYNLHDNAQQDLLAIRFDIENLFSGQDDSATLQSKSKRVMATILDTVGKIRSMQGDLWPYVLDDIGILATIDWYCREFEKNHAGLTIEREDGLSENEIPSSTKIVIYRILQETLSNVAKHSQASRVTLRLKKIDSRMEFTVEDNGIGFDLAEAIVGSSPLIGLGLLSIKARTELSGGHFGVEPVTGKGTTVRASWPI